MNPQLLWQPSVPRVDNPVVHLAAAVAALGAWKPPVRIDETTRTYFTRLMTFAAPADAARYRALLGSDAKADSDAADYLATHDPSKASMVRSSLSPTLLSRGLQVNVIPSEAKGTIDVRLLPGDESELHRFVRFNWGSGIRSQCVQIK